MYLNVNLVYFENEIYLLKVIGGLVYRWESLNVSKDYLFKCCKFEKLVLC